MRIKAYSNSQLYRQLRFVEGEYKKLYIEVSALKQENNSLRAELVEREKVEASS